MVFTLLREKPYRRLISSTESKYQYRRTNTARCSSPQPRRNPLTASVSATASTASSTVPGAGRQSASSSVSPHTVAERLSALRLRQVSMARCRVIRPRNANRYVRGSWGGMRFHASQ